MTFEMATLDEGENWNSSIAIELHSNIIPSFPNRHNHYQPTMNIPSGTDEPAFRKDQHGDLVMATTASSRPVGLSMMCWIPKVM